MTCRVKEVPVRWCGMLQSLSQDVTYQVLVILVKTARLMIWSTQIASTADLRGLFGKPCDAFHAFPFCSMAQVGMDKTPPAGTQSAAAMHVLDSQFRNASTKRMEMAGEPRRLCDRSSTATAISYCNYWAEWSSPVRFQGGDEVQDVVSRFGAQRSGPGVCIANQRSSCSIWHGTSWIPGAWMRACWLSLD